MIIIKKKKKKKRRKKKRRKKRKRKGKKSDNIVTTIFKTFTKRVRLEHRRVDRNTAVEVIEDRRSRQGRGSLVERLVKSEGSLRAFVDVAKIVGDR